MIDSEIHDATYRGVLEAAGQIDRDRPAHHVFVLRRGNQTFYANKLDSAGHWIQEPAARQAVEDERTRSWTEPEAYRFTNSLGPLRQTSQTTAHLLPPDWNRQLDQIEELAQALISRRFDPTAGLAPARDAAAAPNAPSAARHPQTSPPRALGRNLSSCGPADALRPPGSGDTGGRGAINQGQLQPEVLPQPSQT